MRVTDLRVHPVKSTAPRPITSAHVLARGLVDDRSWVVVDGDGVLVSAREEHALFSVTADTPATDPSVSSALRLHAPGMEELTVAQPTGPLVRARVFTQELLGVPAGDEADAWLRKVMGRDDLRLVWCDDPTRRRLNPAFSSPGDHTAFADGYPVTIATEASLRQLNDWIAEAAVERGEQVPEPLPMARFRANIVVDGVSPFDEDGWRRVTVGEVAFRVAKPVDRCVVTTLDGATLRTGHEPIRTLARHRLSADHKTLFAVHLIPVTTGTVRVGDPVTAQ